jgi:predicted transcriptional regulator
MSDKPFLNKLAKHISNVESHAEEVDCLEKEMIAQGASPEELEQIKEHKDAIAYFEQRNNSLLIEMQQLLEANKPKD